MDPYEPLAAATRREFQEYRRMVGLPEGETSPLLEVLRLLALRLEELEGVTPDESSGFHRAAQERTEKRVETATEPAVSPSFAATPGTAEKPLRSGSVSRQEIGEPTIRAIMVGSKSTKSTLPELVEFSENSSILRLTLRWPTPSTPTTEAGDRGVASPDPAPAAARFSSSGSPDSASGNAEEPKSASASSDPRMEYVATVEYIGPASLANNPHIAAGSYQVTDGKLYRVNHESTSPAEGG